MVHLHSIGDRFWDLENVFTVSLSVSLQIAIPAYSTVVDVSSRVAIRVACTRFQYKPLDSQHIADIHIDCEIVVMVTFTLIHIDTWTTAEHQSLQISKNKAALKSKVIKNISVKCFLIIHA